MSGNFELLLHAVRMAERTSVHPNLLESPEFVTEGTPPQDWEESLALEALGGDPACQQLAAAPMPKRRACTRTRKSRASDHPSRASWSHAQIRQLLAAIPQCFERQRHLRDGKWALPHYSRGGQHAAADACSYEQLRGMLTLRTKGSRSDCAIWNALRRYRQHRKDVLEDDDEEDEEEVGVPTAPPSNQKPSKPPDPPSPPTAVLDRARAVMVAR